MPRVELVGGEQGVEILYEATRCSRCVISSAFPDALLGDDGECSYCRANEPDSGGHAASRAQALQLVAEAAPDRTADVVVLYSGGKDSTLALMTLVDWGLRVVAFTLDNGFMSLEARDNIARTIDALAVDHICLRPGGGLMDRLYRESIRKPANPDALKFSTAACGSCISVVLSTGAAEARRRGAPLLAGGWTPGQFTDNALVPGSFLRSVCDGHLGPLALRSALAKADVERVGNSPDALFPPLFNPLYCSPYDETKVIESLASVGWSRPSDTDSCSSNCVLNGFLVVDHALKYGYHPYEYELAHHVRTGQMARDAAIQKLRRVQVSQASLKRLEDRLDANLIANRSDHGRPV